MNTTEGIREDKTAVWRQTPWVWLSFIVLTPLLIVIYYDGLDRMVLNWVEREEYSHGLLIPLLSVFLIWQKKDRLEQIPFEGSWGGFAVTVLGIALYFLGEMSGITIIAQYSFIITIFGLAYAFVGRRAIREIWVAFLFLVFMVPLPAVIFQNLSQELQLISSRLGVAVIRLFDISVYLEGNVIDLGVYKLQVVEACSGLRYLFPLMSLAFICAYFFKDAFWKRAVVFLSSIPVTIIMNSLRIGVIGVLVEYGGISMAEGFLHYFEGWVVFMLCMGILFAEMWFLAKLGKNKRPWREVFGLEFPAATPEGVNIRKRSIPHTYIVAGGLVVIATVFSLIIVKRVDVQPPRHDFLDFPAQLGQWHGKPGKMEQIYLDQLRLDDYLLSDYTDRQGSWVNLYIAYYGSQRKGHSVHSPRACIPGGGWRIQSLDQKMLDAIRVNDAPLSVNRAVIQRGEMRHLVYYWFKQRDRAITNEYMVKWYLFWDALTRNRTDGALVRLTTVVQPNETMESADSRLTALLQEVQSTLPAYIPD